MNQFNLYQENIFMNSQEKFAKLLVVNCIIISCSFVEKELKSKLTFKEKSDEKTDYFCHFWDFSIREFCLWNERTTKTRKEVKIDSSRVVGPEFGFYDSCSHEIAWYMYQNMTQWQNIGQNLLNRSHFATSKNSQRLSKCTQDLVVRSQMWLLPKTGAATCPLANTRARATS